MFIHAPLFRKETKVRFTKSYRTDICRQAGREKGYDTVKIEHLYEAYQLHVNMMFSIKYEFFTYNRFFFELIFQITSITLRTCFATGKFHIFHTSFILQVQSGILLYENT